MGILHSAQSFGGAHSFTNSVRAIGEFGGICRSRKSFYFSLHTILLVQHSWNSRFEITEIAQWF